MPVQKFKCRVNFRTTVGLDNNCPLLFYDCRDVRNFDFGSPSVCFASVHFIFALKFFCQLRNRFRFPFVAIKLLVQI